MELSLQINPINSTSVRKSVPFNQKRTLKISCKAAKGTPSMQKAGKPINFYEVLSLDYSKNVGFDEIKKAYRCKALEFHPDSCPPSIKDESTRRFIEIKMAYETLANPTSREIYDLELSLVGDEGSRRRSLHGRRYNGGVEEFPREVWERQLMELNLRSLKKFEKRMENRR